ncbi:hypothetical protein CZ787_12965 [Halomonas citrativorans]|uniref:Uncharacterized protein n=1 Tax=Halomonas citrativorans TaxID=2742612 RepID=A0A1R4I3S8_9GAMM|nr:hypothetical protein [Halomonas citrativorans]SJN14003.1 hypothetical protein CZ787_12965 [Halomonas citrativorans]
MTEGSKKIRYSSLDTGFFVPIQQTLLDIDELHSFTSLSTFAQHIPVEWIESALHLSG